MDTPNEQPNPKRLRYRPADPDEVDQRDRSPAGRVLLVLLGTLAIGALMNSETMLRQAETSELGPGRDISLLFWRPIERVGSALGFGLPRSGIETVGRDDGSIVAELAIGDRPVLGHQAHVPDPAGPTTDTADAPTSDSLADGEAAAPEDTLPWNTRPRETAPTAGSVLGGPLGPPQPTDSESDAGTADAGPLDDGTTTAGSSTTIDEDTALADDNESAGGESVFPLRRPTVDDPLRVLVVGDSTMDSVGQSLLRELSATGLTDARLDFRISSGLSRPDFFDWPAYLREAKAAERTEVIVFMIGANDAQPLLVDGKAESYGTDQWFVGYRQRVIALLEEITANGTWVLWIGQPAMANSDLDGKMVRLNQIFVEEVAFYSTALYVDSREVMSDEAGAYTAYLPDAAGIQQLIRRSDGVHLTPAGGDRLSPVVIEALNEIAPLY